MSYTRCLLQMQRAVQRTPHSLSSRRVSILSRSTQCPGLQYTRHFSITPRWRDTLQAPDYLNEKEKEIFEKLKGQLEPTKLEVQDISGGCGSMYGLDIVSPKFAGLSVVKQHKMVNNILAEDIKGWHGVQLKTKAP